MRFLEKLEARMEEAASLLCVGLDPVLEQIPKQFHTAPDVIFAFNKWIIDQTHEYACAFKPNSAFYESSGEQGIASLKKTFEYLRENYPEIPTILDAKRGDIGHTNAEYAKFAFEYLGADAITLQPYLGSEALSDFFAYEDKGLIILCKTSNPGSGEFQDLLVSHDTADEQRNLQTMSAHLQTMKPTKQMKLWESVALRVSTAWQEQTKADLLLVVGAVYEAELQRVRELAPEITLLVPGVGTQGGELQSVLERGKNKSGKGIIVNVSRAIIYAQNPKQVLFDLWKSQNKND